MSRRKAPAGPLNPAQRVSRFDRLLTEVSDRRSKWQAFQDFVTLSALSIQNNMTGAPTPGPRYAEREAEYMAIAKGYQRPELDGMVEMLALAIEEVAESGGDFLGSAFQRNELASHWHGQFFTPWAVAYAMAKMTMHDAKALVEEKGYVTLLEPCCGAGVMILAAAQAMKDEGLEPRDTLVVEAVDLDRTAALMAYVQLSAAGLPAIVRVGDSLKNEYREFWATPEFVGGGWGALLAPAVQSMDKQPVIEVTREQSGQIPLFGVK